MFTFWNRKSLTRNTFSSNVSYISWLQDHLSNSRFYHWQMNFFNCSFVILHSNFLQKIIVNTLIHFTHTFCMYTINNSLYIIFKRMQRHLHSKMRTKLTKMYCNLTNFSSKNSIFLKTFDQLWSTYRVVVRFLNLGSW